MQKKRIVTVGKLERAFLTSQVVVSVLLGTKKSKDMVHLSVTSESEKKAVKKDKKRSFQVLLNEEESSTSSKPPAKRKLSCLLPDQSESLKTGTQDDRRVLRSASKSCAGGSPNISSMTQKDESVSDIGNSQGPRAIERQIPELFSGSDDEISTDSSKGGSDFLDTSEHDPNVELDESACPSFEELPTTSPWECDPDLAPSIRGALPDAPDNIAPISTTKLPMPPKCHFLLTWYEEWLLLLLFAKNNKYKAKMWGLQYHMSDDEKGQLTKVIKTAIKRLHGFRAPSSSGLHRFQVNDVFLERVRQTLRKTINFYLDSAFKYDSSKKQAEKMRVEGATSREEFRGLIKKLETQWQSRHEEVIEWARVPVHEDGKKKGLAQLKIDVASATLGLKQERITLTSALTSTAKQMEKMNLYSFEVVQKADYAMRMLVLMIEEKARTLGYADQLPIMWKQAEQRCGNLTQASVKEFEQIPYLVESVDPYISNNEISAKVEVLLDSYEENGIEEARTKLITKQQEARLFSLLVRMVKSPERIRLVECGGQGDCGPLSLNAGLRLLERQGHRCKSYPNQLSLRKALLEYYEKTTSGNGTKVYATKQGSICGKEVSYWFTDEDMQAFALMLHINVAVIASQPESEKAVVVVHCGDPAEPKKLITIFGGSGHWQLAIYDDGGDFDDAQLEASATAGPKPTWKDNVKLVWDANGIDVAQGKFHVRMMSGY